MFRRSLLHAREFPYNHWRAAARVMKVTHHTGLFGRQGLFRSGAPGAAPGREYPVGTKWGRKISRAAR